MSDLDKKIEKLLEKKLAEMLGSKEIASFYKKPLKKDVPPAGAFLQQLLDACERIPSGSRRQGIRFKLGPDHIDTSVELGLKNEAEQILDMYGITISRACHAALLLVLEEARKDRKK